MTKITLSDRSEEIFKLLPKNYAEIILNSIIARSIDNGSLIDESKIFLNNNSLNELMDSLELKENSTKKILKQKNSKEVTKDSNKDKKDDELSEKEGLELFDC